MISTQKAKNLPESYDCIGDWPAYDEGSCLIKGHFWDVRDTGWQPQVGQGNL